MARWIEEQGLEDWSERDQLDFYEAAFPRSLRNEAAQRRLERNARLTQRALE